MEGIDPRTKEMYDDIPKDVVEQLENTDMYKVGERILKMAKTEEEKEEVMDIVLSMLTGAFTDIISLTIGPEVVRNDPSTTMFQAKLVSMVSVLLEVNLGFPLRDRQAQRARLHASEAKQMIADSLQQAIEAGDAKAIAALQLLTKMTQEIENQTGSVEDTDVTEDK